VKIITDIDHIPEFDSPISLTLGVYDGLHLGHQTIIKQLHKQTRKKGTRIILTFSSHPSQLFSQNQPAPLIISLNHRLHLFQEFGIHAAIVLPFTPTFAEQSYKDFLVTLFAKLPFDYLTLGQGATLGKEQQGNEANLTALGSKMGFEVKYLKKENHHKDEISSGRIRKAIEEGALKKVKKLLGRPYSIRAPFDPSDVIRENDSLLKWSISFKNLALLPSAAYSMHIEGEEKTSAIGFLKGTTSLTGETELTLTLFFKKMPSATPYLNLIFIEQAHSHLNPISLLQKLLPQPVLS